MTIGARIVLILLALSVFAGIVTGSQFYYRISYFWGLLFVGSWLWSKLVLRGLKFNRRERTLRAQVGQVFEERFEINNPTRLPRLLVTVRDESQLPESQASRVFPIIEAYRGRSYLVRTLLTRRGVFPLGPTTMESGDPFGLFPVKQTIPPEEALLVYPMMVEVRTFPMPMGVMPGGEALRRRTQQVTPNAAGVREYAPGDPLNRIHWVSTARRGRLITKEFELDPQADIWIFLDAMEASQASLPEQKTAPAPESLWQRGTQVSLPPSTEEYCVSIAASLCRHYLRQGRSVGFAAAGQSVSVLPPDRGGRQLGKILEALSLIRARGALPLHGLVRAQSEHLSRGTTTVLITSSVAQEVALASDNLARRGLRPVVVLVDSESFGGPPGSDQLAETLQFLNVPVRKVDRGAKLEVALSGS